ncbi:MAG: MFS transporter [Nitrolancea sp.]
MASTTTEIETASLAATLDLRTKLAWGIAGLGSEALRQSRVAWLVFFYASASTTGSTARLSLVTVSLLFSVGKLLEAFADTLIGHWSDRTRSRLGRRLPFILLASPPMTLLAILLFTPPAHLSGLVTGLYFFTILEAFFLCNSLVSVPYESLLPEIASTRDDRVTITSWRVQFGVVGAGVGLIGSGLLISQFGYQVMAVTLALLALVTRYVGVMGIWSRTRRDTPRESAPYLETLRLTVSNRPFLIFMISFVLFSTGLSIVIGLLPFYVTAVLRESDTGTWSGLLTAVGIASMAVAIPLFGRFAKRTSNEHAYLRAMLACAIAFQILFFAGSLPGIPRAVQAFVALVIVGAPLAGVYLFPGPIIAEHCDAELNKSGLRREGMFFSTQAFTDKVVEAFAPLVLGFVLLLGHEPGTDWGVRLVGPVAGLLVLSGYVLFRSKGGVENGQGSEIAPALDS